MPNPEISRANVINLATEIESEATRQVRELIEANTALSEEPDAYLEHDKLMATGSAEEDLGWQVYEAQEVLRQFAEGQPEPTTTELVQAMTTLMNTEVYTFLHPKTT